MSVSYVIPVMSLPPEYECLNKSSPSKTVCCLLFVRVGRAVGQVVKPLDAQPRDREF